MTISEKGFTPVETQCFEPLQERKTLLLPLKFL
jgi:hypothetical protein